MIIIDLDFKSYSLDRHYSVPNTFRPHRTNEQHVCGLARVDERDLRPWRINFPHINGLVFFQAIVDLVLREPFGQ